MSVRNLSSMMRPSCIVLIAAPHGASTISGVVARNLLSSEFGGEIFAVDIPDTSTAGIAGVGKGSIKGKDIDAEGLESITSFPSIESLPKPPDLAVITAEAGLVPELVARLGKCGAKAAAVITAGQRKNGIGHDRDGRLRAAVMEAAEPHGLRIAGPGSPGIIVPGANLNASFSHVKPLKGNLAFVSQSGDVLTSVLDWATSRNIGFSHLVSLGGMADVDFGDMLDYLANDTDTRAILLHLETVTRVRKFMSAARLATRMKPVIVLKGARYSDGERPTTTHAAWTAGASAGAGTDVIQDAVYDAAFRRVGMLRVHDLRELLDAAEMLSKARTVTGDRLAILTNGRGVGVLAKDGFTEEGGHLAELARESVARLQALLPAAWYPSNPVYIMEDADGGRYAEAIEILLGDQGVDAVLVLHCPTGLASGIEIARSIIDAMKKDGLKSKANRLLTSWLGDGAAAPARRLFSENRIPGFDTPRQAVRALMRVIHYRGGQEMLMQTPPCAPEARSPDVREARRVIGRALDEGREWLGEDELKQLLAAYAIPFRSGARPKSAHELMVGAFEDARFGPVILFGQGGVAADVIGDNALALPPLDMRLARELMERTRVFRLLEGRCGLPAVDMDGVALTLVKVSQLLCDVPEIVEMEINPLFADEREISAGGGRIRIAAASAPATGRLAVRPYPKELEETLKLPDGHTILLRPIRAEDEPAYHKLFASLPAEDIFMRFMSPMRALPHNLAARLTQLDYDREMALILVEEGEPGAPELCGGVRISADADNDRAEFAILLRRDMTGMGLGPMMMRRIIRYAQSRGIREIYGEVLSDNTPMLKLCKALGFGLKRELDDPGVVIATLEL